MDKEAVFLELVREGELEVDAEGRIWRLQKRLPNRVTRAITRYPCTRVRAEYRQRQGYLLITTTIEGTKTVTGAHRVVWAHANGPIPAGLTINHKNGVKDDNRPENLELATMSEQRRHAVDVLNVNRNRPKGSLNPKAQLKEADVLEIRRMRAEGMMVKDIAAEYDMTAKAVSAICRRRTWLHI